MPILVPRGRAVIFVRLARSDEELLEAWRGGDNESGTELFRRHFNACRRFFCNKVPEADVEDLLQKTFAGLVESRDSFRREASVRTFLFSIARRKLMRHLRDFARRGSKHEPDMGVSSVVMLGVTPGTALQNAQEQEEVRLALQRIPVHLQTVLELSYWEEIPHAELAEILDIEPATVRTRLFRARKALARELEGKVRVDADDVDEAARGLKDLV